MMDEKTTNPAAVELLKMINSAQLNNKSLFSEFELEFINSQMARFEKFGDETYFSVKQVALLERIQTDRVLGKNPLRTASSVN